MPLAEVSRHFTGIALELTPEADFRPGVEQQTVGLRQLLGRVTGLKRSLVQIFLLALALEAFVLLTPFYLQWVVDGVLVSNDRDLLVTLGIGFGLLVLIQVGAGAIRSWAVLHLSATLNLQWLGNVFAHLMRLPVSWFERRHTGDVMSRFGAVQQIQKTMTTSFVEAVLDGLLVVVTLAMMLVYSGTLTAIAAAGVVAYALLRRAFFRPLREATEEAIVFDAKRSTHFLESLRGVQSIKLFNRQADRQARFMNLVVDAMNADIATRRLDLMFVVLHKLVFGLERVAVIWVGALLVLEHRFSVGMLFAFLAYKEQFAQRVSGADRQGGRDQDAAAAGRAPGRHRAGRARSRWSTCRRAWARRRRPSRCVDVGFAYSGGGSAGAAQAEPAHRAGRFGGDRRAVGLRQDDLAEVHARHPRAAGRADPDRRRRPAAGRACAPGAT